MSSEIELKSVTTQGSLRSPSSEDVSADSNYGSMEVYPNNEVKSQLENGNNLQKKKITNGKHIVQENTKEIEDDDDDEDDVPDNNCARFVNRIQSNLRSFYKRSKNTIWTIFWVIMILLYLAYVGYALNFRFGDEGSYRLLVCTIIGVVGIAVYYIKKALGDKVTCSCSFFETKTGTKVLSWIGYFLKFAVFVFSVVYIVIDVGLENPENLVSLAGLAAFVVIFYVTSHNPAKVNWQPVFWGLAIQFIFALLILRWSLGYQIFKWLGDRVTEFLAYAQEGSKFVFGDKYVDHFFAFGVLAVVIFFSTMTTVLYYLGIMQFVIKYVARFIAMAMGTSATESLNAAANIFMGQTEAPLTIRPFLPIMTKSELHAVCTGGFATVAGSVLAAYILFEVPANHLLSASVMSAPAALAMAKLAYPETKKSRANAAEVYNMPKSQERNVIEAASSGATQSVKLVANIAVNLIAFISILEFVNATLRWFGARAGLEQPEHEELTFQLICSYLFYPIAYLMGVAPSDCRRVGELIGIKTFINEMVAYKHLGVFITNKKNLTWYEGLVNSTNSSSVVGYTGDWTYNLNGDILYTDLNITLVGGILQERSVVIATYALCGFSNISSIGIMLGGLGAMAPSRKSDLSAIVVRAMIAGNVACFMTACVAGLLYKGEF